MKLSREGWLEAMALGADEVPVGVVSEGTWWEERAYEARLAHLDDVRELAFPGVFWGRWRGVPVAFCCAYGAPRAVEPVHAFGSVGTRVAVQIGSCGGLQPGLRTGDVVLPERAAIGEGASAYYGAKDASYASPRLLDAAERALTARGLTTHRGPHLTTSSLFMQSAATIDAWRAAGHLGVDMETSAVYSATASFGMEAVALLFVWDELLRGRTWLEPFPEAERARQERANREIFEVALELIADAAGEETA